MLRKPKNLVLVSAVMIGIVVFVFTFLTKSPRTQQPIPRSDASESDTNEHAIPAVGEADNGSNFVPGQTGDLDSSYIHETNPLFKNVDASTLQYLQPFIEQKFFNDPDNDTYRRHTVVEIDTEGFRNQLQDARQLRLDGVGESHVVVPVFMDRSIDVEIYNEIDNPLGMVGMLGHVVNESAPPDSAIFKFTYSGSLTATLQTYSTTYYIAEIADAKYYLVMELGPLGAID